MDDDPRKYDKQFTASVGTDSPVRQRLGIDTDRGDVTRFVVQLEYLIDPTADEWATVVRYDHDSKGSKEATHDVTEDGVPMDVYHDGEKAHTDVIAPPLPPNDALEKAEDHLAEHNKGLIRRFEQWHGISR